MATKKLSKEKLIEALHTFSVVKEIVNGKNSTHFQFVYAIYVAKHLKILPTSVRRAIRRAGLEALLLEIKQQKIQEYKASQIGQTCRKCRTHKPFAEFNKYERIKSGYRLTCKECRHLRYKTNEVHIKARSIRNYYENHEENKRKRSEYSAKPENMQKAKIRHNIKMKNDKVYALKYRVRCNIRKTLCKRKYLNGNYQSKRTSKILGVSYKEFAEYIESQFTHNMTWENMSDWHLDHIVPIKYANTLEEVYKLNNYQNFRPLWANENLERNANCGFIPDTKNYSIEALVMQVLEHENFTLKKSA